MAQQESIRIIMSQEDTGRYVLSQLWSMNQQDSQQNVSIHFGPSSKPVKMNGAVLSVLSPVWQAKLCRGLTEVSRSRLDLTLDDAASFATVVELGCGRPVAVRGGLAGLLDIGRLADAYGVEHVHRAVEWEAARRLTVDACAELLAGAAAAGMPRLEGACRELALGEFDAVARTEGFVRLGEEELGALLDQEMLAAVPREAAIAAVQRWMRPCGYGAGGGCRAVPTRIGLFVGLVDSESQAADSHGEANGGIARISDGARLAGGSESPALVDCGAIAASGAAAPEPPSAFSPPLQGPGVGAATPPAAARRRGRYPVIGPPIEAKLMAEQGNWTSHKTCVAVGRGIVACGQTSGLVSAARLADLSPYIQQAGESAVDRVIALVVWGGLIAAGHSQGRIDIWQIGRDRSRTRSAVAAAGDAEAELLECIGTLDAGPAALVAMGASSEESGGERGRLVGASFDKTVRVWAAGTTARTWSCERTMTCRCYVECLTAWGVSAAAGCYDGKVYVWDLASGAVTVVLPDISGDRVVSMAADKVGGRLITASKSGTVRVWGMGAWTCDRVLAADAGCAAVHRLAVSGGWLFGGLASSVKRGDRGAGGAPAVRVWNLDTLELVSELRMQEGLPAGQRVQVDDIVVVGEGEVWAVVDGTLLVWGRKPTAVRVSRTVSEGIKATQTLVAGSDGPAGSVVPERAGAACAAMETDSVGNCWGQHIFRFFRFR